MDREWSQVLAVSVNAGVICVEAMVEAASE